MTGVTAWNVDDVVIWLKCLGFAEKAGPFQTNEVAGDIILTLSSEELTEDLGMTKLQARRALRAIAFTKDISESGVDKIEDNEQKVEILRTEYENLKRQYYKKNDKIEYLETKIDNLKVEREVEAVPQAPPQYKEEHNNHQQDYHRRGPGVVGGAAGGAAGGALKGAIVGAVLPDMDASDGAKAGAAVGAVGGAGEGFRNRRLRR